MNDVVNLPERVETAWTAFERGLRERVQQSRRSQDFEDCLVASVRPLFDLTAAEMTFNVPAEHAGAFEACVPAVRARFQELIHRLLFERTEAEIAHCIAYGL